MDDDKPVFFRLVDTDLCPEFIPMGQHGGRTFGIAKVIEPGEVERLRKRKCVEIVEEQYEGALKKKLNERDSLGIFRTVLDSAATGGLISQQAALAAQQKAAEPVKVDSATAIAPRPIPRTRK